MQQAKSTPVTRTVAFAADPRRWADQAERGMKRARWRIGESWVRVLALLCCLMPCGPLDCLAGSQAKGPAAYEAPSGLSDAQTVALASEVVKYVAANPHNSEDWRWVRVDLPDKQLPQLSAIVRGELAKRYTVVEKDGTLPAGARSTARPHELENGFLLSIRVRHTRKDRVKVSYRDYEGPVAGSAQTVKYEWVGAKWKTVSRSDMVIY
jgi:hypothetical protein